MRTHKQFYFFAWLIALLINASLFAYSPSFAQSVVDITATVTRNANLRGGPGTSFAVIGGATQGQAIHIVEKNAAGDWYKLESGQWIAAFLVTAEAQVPATDPVAPTATPAPAGSAVFVLQTVYYDGAVPDVESDEYAVIANTGTALGNLKDWQLDADDPGQVVTFPSYELQPGQSCRVYTNEMHGDSCGVSFGSGKAVWNNDGDCGHLYDPSRSYKSDFCYNGAGGQSVANRSANLRGGPGTNYPVVGSVQNGQSLNVVSQSPAGDWYQLDNGQWIAAFLVTTASPADEQSAAPTATPAPAQPTPAPTVNPLSGQRSGAVCRDGTTSGATGRGACSHHGGVDHWTYYP